MSTMQRDQEELVDLLLDLQHDLGKYLRMPLAFLPETASAADVRAALRQALFETRQSAKGIRSARMLWESFVQTIDGRLDGVALYRQLVAAIERALRWEEIAADPNAEVDRQRALEDFSAITPAVRAIMGELDDAT